MSLDNGVSFQQWKNGYPSVSTYDLAIQEREADLVIATFGRAIYVLDDIRPLRKLASAKGIIPARLMVFPARMLTRLRIKMHLDMNGVPGDYGMRKTGLGAQLFLIILILHQQKIPATEKRAR